MGFTQQSAQMVDPNYIGNPAVNLYFLIVSAVILTIVATFITEKYVAPRFKEYQSPLFPYFPMLMAFAKKYDENIGMGTIMASMIPYSVAFFVIWVILLLVFRGLGLPLGPGGVIYYSI
jgi:p-aminobenzoyl-glutamate transporter AbgT